MPAPQTLAVLTATIEREGGMSGSSQFTELFKVEVQTLGDDGDRGPVLFGYNSGAYAFLETLPESNPVQEARSRIGDYVLDADLVDVEVKRRNNAGNTE